MIAKPKAGKSTLARSLALAVARGDPWLGHATNQGLVFYLALEEKPAEVREHFLAMGATGDEPLQIVFGPAPRETIRQLEAAAAKEHPALIIVDTLQQLVQAKDLNDYAEMTRQLTPLQLIARGTGAHVQFVHHARKGRLTADGDGVLGSTAILGGVDTAILVQRGKNCRSLWTIQRYGTDLEETVFELDPETRTPYLAGGRDAFERGVLERALIAALETAPEPLTEDDLQDRVSGKTGPFRRALRNLVATGRVTRLGRGVRGDPFRYGLQESSPTLVSRSLVPKELQEQERSIRGGGSAEDTPLDSRSHVPAPAVEQENEKRGDDTTAATPR
jgi:hypothetical protein